MGISNRETLAWGAFDEGGRPFSFSLPSIALFVPGRGPPSYKRTSP